MPRELNDILVTIRLVESGNNYAIGKNRGGASGAYQYIDSTWGNYKGFPSAYLAPPWVQDEKALADVKAILATWHGDVSMVPVIWYYPKAAREPALMDQVPMPQAGNRLTVREYQLRWLTVLAQVSGQEFAGLAFLLPPALRDLAGLPPQLVTTDDALLQVAYPVLGRSVVAPPIVCDADTCEPGTDAIIYGQKLQPVLAAADGVVTAVSRDRLTGGVSVTVTDPGGRTFLYRGFNDDSPGTNDGAGHPALGLSALAQVGTTIRAGQVLGFMGDTDPMPLAERRGIDPDVPVWPHLRLQIRDADGTRLDADQLVAQAQNRMACHVGTGPWASVPDPRLANPDDAELAELAAAIAEGGGDPADNPALAPDGYDQLEPVDVSALVDGGFRIAADGTVQAYGKSALILHPLGCEWAPTVAFGFGASGGEPLPGFFEPIQLAARYWVKGTATTLAQADPGLPQVMYRSR